MSRRFSAIVPRVRSKRFVSHAVRHKSWQTRLLVVLNNSWKLGVLSHSEGFGAGRGTLPQDSIRFPTGFPIGFPTGFPNKVPNTVPNFPTGFLTGTPTESQQGFPTKFLTGLPTGFSNRVFKQGSQTGFPTGFSNNVPTTFPKQSNTIPNRVPSFQHGLPTGFATGLPTGLEQGWKSSHRVPEVLDFRNRVPNTVPNTVFDKVFELKRFGEAEGGQGIPKISFPSMELSL